MEQLFLKIIYFENSFAIRERKYFALYPESSIISKGKKIIDKKDETRIAQKEG